MTGFVSIIGAGCGAYDLITLRGLNALKKCSVVVYDALIDSTLLDFAAPDAELICVGKRSGKHSAAQEQINRILIEKATAGHKVARLKGGDPFVFGRGGEEISALQNYGIPFEVVPGISSAIAVPELSGIPVTHRNTSREFHVITAHTSGGKQDFSKYARLEGTLVFLMGLAALPDIVSDLLKAGMPAETPAAVIANGCTAEQKVIRSVLSQIIKNAELAGISAPAVIVIGSTAKYDFSGSSYSGGSHHTSITVTGTDKFTKKVSSLFADEGTAIREYPHIRIRKKNQIPPFEKYGCIAFTSSYGAEIFISHCIEEQIDMRTLAGIKIAAVGSGTYRTLSSAGLIPDIIPENYTVGDLANAIAKNVSGGEKVLVLRAALGSDELNPVLEQHQVPYDDIKIYDTVRCDLPAIHTSSDYIIFGSSFGVRSFFEYGCTLSERTAIVCIGEQTAETVGQYTNNKVITAFPHSAEGIFRAVKGDLQNEKIQTAAGK